MKRAGLTLMLACLSLSARLQNPHAEPSANYVAYVESVAGAVDGAQGKLNILDPVADGARLYLESSSSELRICHFVTHQLKSLKGPMRALVSSKGITAETGAAVTSAGACATPVISMIQGGVALRAIPPVVEVSLRPRIKFVNETGQPIKAATLQDIRTETVEELDHAEAVIEPQLWKNQAYLLSIKFADGSASQMKLYANPGADPAVVIVRIR